MGLSYGYAQRIVQQYNQKGEAGVQAKPRAKQNHTGGKKALLSDEQLGKLAQALESNKSDGGIWTGVKVARWIEQETGIEKVWNQRGWDYLKKCPKGLASRRITHGRHQDRNTEKQMNQSKQNLSKISQNWLHN